MEYITITENRKRYYMGNVCIIGEDGRVLTGRKGASKRQKWEVFGCISHTI